MSDGASLFALIVVFIIKIMICFGCYAYRSSLREQQERERRQEIDAIVQLLQESQTVRVQLQPSGGFYLGAPPSVVDVTRTREEHPPPPYETAAPAGTYSVPATMYRPHHEPYNNCGNVPKLTIDGR